MSDFVETQLPLIDGSSWQRIDLGEPNHLLRNRLPRALNWDHHQFATVWDRHPADFHRTPRGLTRRFQQAYGADYQYSGSRANALHIPDDLRPLLTWAQRNINLELNGLLLNWYELEFGIGQHSDSCKNLIPNSPIVTVSFGATRRFRMTSGTGEERTSLDITVTDGDVLILPWRTNLAWKHGVPQSKRSQGRRISVTLRAFQSGLIE